MVFVFIATIFSIGNLNAEETKTIDKEKSDNIFKLLEVQGIIGDMKKIKSPSPNILGDDFQEESLKMVHERMISAYDKYLDNKDILELIKLFESPTWKKFKETQPLIMKDIIESTKAYTDKYKALADSEKDVPISKMNLDPNSSISKQFIKSKEGKTQGVLLQIRASVTMYYAKNEGQFPKSLTEGFEKYLASIPSELITGSNKIVNKFDGKGGWYYNIEQGSKDFGQVFLNVEGKDSKGKDYSTY